MRYLKIVAIEDNMTGDLGFNLVNNAMPNTGEEFVAGGGLIIAHDIIEHQQGLKKIGTLEDELIALGGIVYTRVITGELSNFVMTGEENLSHDITRMFEYFNENTKRTGKKYYPKRLLEEYECDSIDETIQKARKSLILNECEEHYYDDSRKTSIEPYLAWTRHLMLHGLYLAEKRFGDSYIALNAFRRIKEEVDRFTPDYEGQEFLLGYDFNQATMRETERED